MRKPLVLLSGIAFLMAIVFISLKFYSGLNSSNGALLSPVPLQQGEENLEEAMEERYEREFEMTKDPALGTVPVERLLVAEQQAKLAAASRQSGMAALTWYERGPSNMGGRTRSVIIDRNDATGNTVLAGSVAGGMWRTTNFKSANPTWTQVSSVSNNLAITCMAQDPNNYNIMYAGTGEGYGNSDAIRGLGIYKTIDGGFTWSLLSSTTTGGANVTDFSYVQKILIYTNGDVYAAAISAINCNRGGVLKSTNGGASWTRVIGTYDGSGSCNGAFDFKGYDLALSKDGDIYATVIDAGNSFTAPATMDTTIGKIYKSPAGTSVGNSGTWINVTPPPPAAANSYWQRIAIACSLTDNNKIYALLQGTSSAIGGIRMSTDGGSTWNTIDNTTLWCDQGTASSYDFSRGQAWYDLAIAIKPNDDQTVFVGGVDLMKTTDGGATWSQATQWTGGCGTLPNIHADNHNIIYFPGSSSEFISVNDGGIYYTADGGNSFSYKASGYNTIQYYCAALHPTAGSNYMLAGAQDNGSHQFNSYGLGPAGTATGGDGAYCFIDQDDPNIQITSYTYCNWFISRNGGTSFTSIQYGSSGRFINPCDYDDVNNSLFGAYTGGKMIRVTNIASGTISAAAYTVTAATTTRTISAVKVDPNTSGKVWTAFSGSGVLPMLFYASNANTTPTFTQVTLPASLTASQYIASVDVEKGNANHLIIAVSNYGVASVYETTDGGTTWSSLDNNGVNLPDMPVRWAMFAPIGTGASIVLATELGVWTTDASNGTSTVWTQSAGIPNVRVDMLDYRSSDKTMVAATHGRGVWTTTLGGTLPVTLLDFKGVLHKNDIQLTWTTSSEQNLKEFEVQKSVDGSSYYKIATVAALGSSNGQKEYALTDLQVNSINYYRLKMIDLDGRSNLSKIVVIRSPGTPQTMWVATNPFKDNIELRFAKPINSLKLDLLDMSGRLLYRADYRNPSQHIQWRLGVNATKGLYILRATADGETLSKKLLKE